jgi:hypothetical protein
MMRDQNTTGVIGAWIDRTKSRINSRFVWETTPAFNEGHRPAWLGDDQVREVRECEDPAVFDPGVVDLDGEVQVVDEPTTMYKAVREGIVKLIIPRGARVVVSRGAANYYRRGLEGGKLRTDVAYVESVENLTGEALRRGHSIWSTKTNGYMNTFTYKPDMWVQTRLDGKTGTSCSNGIHCFKSEQGAHDWWERSFW